MQRKLLASLFLVLLLPRIAFADACSGQGASGGEIARGIRNLGRMTGVKPVQCIGAKAGKEWQRTTKNVPLIGDVEHMTTDQVRDTGRWIKTHPDDAIEIGMVVVAAWAACADGCTVLVNLVVKGVTIPVGAAIIGNDPSAPNKGDTDSATYRPLTEASSPTSEPSPEASATSDKTSEGSGTAPSSTDDSTSSMWLQRSFPRFVARGDNPNFIVKYQSPNDQLSNVFNSFAPPTRPVQVRTPTQDDPAGGVFLSPRVDLGNSADAVAAKRDFGDGARRVHGGTDFLASPGQPVFADMSGVVERWFTVSGFDAIQIRSKDQTTARILYIKKADGLHEGDPVEAGVTRVGTAIDISGAYNPKEVPNHVHTDYTDYLGRRFDPWTNEVLEKISPPVINESSSSKPSPHSQQTPK